MTETYRFTIGRFHCTAINDGTYVGNAGMLFANAPEDELSAALARHGETADSMPTTWTCLLVRTGSQNVLIDTGGGKGSGIGGQLMPWLQHEGLSAEEIDFVILTHVHGDHIGGCLREDGQPAFPNATYVMGKDEWQFWTTESTLETAPQWAADTARRVLPSLSDRMREVEDGTSIVQGVRAIYAPGHTVGHMVVEIQSQGDQLLYLADIGLHPIHLEHPHWTARVDQIPEQTIQTRVTLNERAVREKALVLLFHFQPFPSLGTILKSGDSWSWRSIDA